MAGKEGKVWSLSRFSVSIRSYVKQRDKKILGRILHLVWLKFAVAALTFEVGFFNFSFAEQNFKTILRYCRICTKKLLKVRISNRLPLKFD